VTCFGNYPEDAFTRCRRQRHANPTFIDGSDRGTFDVEPVAGELAKLGQRVLQSRVVEIRTLTGPSSAVQWVLSGGPYTTASQFRQRQLMCPPPPCPRQATCPTRTWPGPSGCPIGHRDGGRVIHRPSVVCTRSPSTIRAYGGPSFAVWLWRRLNGRSTGYIPHREPKRSQRRCSEWRPGSVVLGGHARYCIRLPSVRLSDNASRSMRCLPT
jgi:hypothetical protein